MEKQSPFIELLMFVFIEKCQNISWSECCRWFGKQAAEREERREHYVTSHHDLWAVIRRAGKLLVKKLFVKYQQIDAEMLEATVLKSSSFIFSGISNFILTTLILSWLSLLSGLKRRRSGCFVCWGQHQKSWRRPAVWLIISNLWARGENMNVCENMKASYWPNQKDKAFPLVFCDQPPSLVRDRPGDGRKETRHRNIANCNSQSGFASMAIMLKMKSMKGCAFWLLLVKLK